MLPIHSSLGLCLLSLCSFLPLSDLQAQTSKNKKKKDDIGLVKKEMHRSFEIIDNKPGDKSYLTTVRFYNAKGKEEKLIFYYKDGSIRKSYSYRYHAEKRLSERFYELNGNTLKDFSSEADLVGNITKLTRYKTDGEVLDASLYKYDAKSRKIEEQYFDNNNQKVYEIFYTYNDAQKTLTEKLRDFKSGDEFIATVQLDDNEQPILRTRYKKTGHLVDKTVYKRDEKGRVIEKQLFPDGKKMRIKERYEYDDANKKMTMSVTDEANSRLLEYAVVVYEY
jgi:hypothetical protein